MKPLAVAHFLVQCSMEKGDAIYSVNIALGVFDLAIFILTIYLTQKNILKHVKILVKMFKPYSFLQTPLFLQHSLYSEANK